MPFREVSKMDERRELVRLAGEPGANLSALGRAFGVDRKTVRKWLARAGEDGGLAERSRRPRVSPGRTDAAMEAAVLALRAAHPAWGGRKLRHALLRQRGEAPAASTITEILRRNGVAVGDLGGGAKPFVRFEHPNPNDLWQMDFKGHVALAAEAGRLHPLTILDDHSRYCIALEACANQQTGTVKSHLTQAFERHGLPQTIITDNGSPWGDGPGSPFTPLGVWLIEHGVRIAHARPYHPQTLGKDERFHRTLALELLHTPYPGIADAACAMKQWRSIYNRERPHQAIGYAVPADRYRPSKRPFRDAVAPFDYPENDIVRRAHAGGRIFLHGHMFRVGRAFHGKDIALRPTETDGVLQAWFRNTRIATLDLATGRRQQ